MNHFIGINIECLELQEILVDFNSLKLLSIFFMDIYVEDLMHFLSLYKNVYF